jgi:hypothetical protein
VFLEKEELGRWMMSRNIMYVNVICPIQFKFSLMYFHGQKYKLEDMREKKIKYLSLSLKFYSESCEYNYNTYINSTYGRPRR